ncbi:MAG: dicarboxylate/amino acid:cation symporter [Treponema sp.]|nr:MAG: dicarboxylate/amino acid:cation symporter [Treponema sp.]
MKIWLKYIIAVAIGLIFAFVSGFDNAVFNNAVQAISEISIQIGRYALYPVVFFGLTIGIFNLRDTKRLGKLFLFFICFTVGAALLLSLIGMLSLWIARPSRIPIFIEKSTEIPVPGIKNFFLRLFPSSAFSALVDGSFIMPLCIFGGFAGMGFSAVEKQFSKPGLNIFDSFSRVAYAVMAFFVDFFALCVVAVSAYWMFRFRTMLASNFFTDFIFLLLIDMIIIVAGVYPLIIKIFCKDVNPYKILYASLAPMLIAFFTGDANATLPVTIRHVHESLGVRRRISNVATPLLSVFAKAGTAMVLTISFMVIFMSYSSQQMGISGMLWLVFISTFFSFFLGMFPQRGAYIAIAGICMLYGSGFEAGYLILKPAVFFIEAVALVINTVTTITGTYIAGYISDLIIDKDARFFI